MKEPNVMTGKDFKNLYKDKTFYTLSYKSIKNNIHNFISFVEESEILKIIARSCRNNKNILKYMKKIDVYDTSVVNVHINSFTSNTFIAGEEIYIWKNQKICNEIVKFAGILLEYVECQNNEICINAALCNYKSITYIKPEIRTEEFYIDLIERIDTKSYYILSYIPKDEQTYNICMAACKKYTYIYTDDIRNDLIIGELAEKIIEKEPLYIKKIKNKTVKLCELAVSKKSNAIKYVPHKYQNYEMCFNAVKDNRYNLKYVNPLLMDYNICIDACLWGDHDLIKYVKNDDIINQLMIKIIDLHPIYINKAKYKTKELYEIAVAKQSNIFGIFGLVPYKYQTYKMCEMIIKNNGGYIKFMNPELMDNKICMQAVSNCGYAIKYVKQCFITKELCKAAVMNDGRAIKYVMPLYVDYDMCLLAVKSNAYAIKYVNKKYQTNELCSIALKSNGNTLQYVVNKTPELCKMAIQNHADAIQYVPNQNTELCKMAVEKGASLWYIKEKYRTSEICHIAVVKNKYELQYVVDEEIKSQLACV